jgi:hypothetical protein
MVQFTDTEFFEDLVEQFPIFKNTIFMLYADKFLSAIGKHVGGLDTLKMDTVGAVVIISVLQKDGTELIVDCGEMISDHLALQYKHVFDEHKINPICAKEKDLLPILQKDAAISFIDIDHFTDRTGKCAMLNNSSGVSVKEFPSKANLFEYTYVMLSEEQGSTVNINTVFKCPIVSVVSVQPAVVWFTKSKTKKDM